MANKIRHRGVIKPTVPEPVVFWGSIQEIADHLRIHRRSAARLFIVEGSNTMGGWRAMKEEEEIRYYEPPKAREPISRKGIALHSKSKWVITFFKDWKKGDKYPPPDDLIRRFSGNPKSFSSFVNCNSGMVFRLLNTHFKLPEKYPLKSVKGWTIARVRKHD